MAENGILDYQGMNQAIYRGATSNIVVDTQSMSIEIGAGNTSHTSNLHFECNHDANVASIKLNSNVTTEFSRSKKLIKYPRVTLTSASYNAYESGYKVTRSNASNSSYQEWEAFDGMPGDGVGWYSGGSAGTEYNGTNPVGKYNGNTRLATETELGEWLGLELPESIKLQYLRLVSQSYSPITNTIDDFILYAKKQSGDTWTSLGLFTGKASAQNSASGVIVNIDANDYYKFFAIVARKSAISSLGVSIRELEYYGVPEYDPEAHGTDVVVKSVPNVPTTDWLEVYYDGQDYTADTDFDQANEVLDKAGADNHGSQTGGVGFDTEYKAFTFDGNGDYIETTLGSHISGDWTNTVSFWIAWNAIPTSGAQTPFMIGQPNTSTNGIGVDFNANGNMIYFTTSGDTLTINNVFDLISPGKWIHFTFIHTPSKKYVYWDGKQVGIWASGGAATLPTSPTLSIGRRGSSPTNYTNAKIANFRLFNRALTSDEIYQLYAYQKEYFGHGDLSMTLKAGRLGIGTSEPEAALDVRGDVHIGGIITSNNPAFHVYRDAGDMTTTDTVIVWNQVRFNRGGCYDSSTGIFHPPVDGMYFFSVFGMSDAINDPAVSFRFEYAPPGGIFDTSTSRTSIIGALWPYQFIRGTSMHAGASGSFVYYLEAGSQFRVLFHGDEFLARGNSHNGFSGFLIG